MAPDARYAADAAILKNLESLPEFAEASVIAAYASDGTEPDLMPLLRRAAGTAKPSACPGGSTIPITKWLCSTEISKRSRQMEHAGTAS